MHRYSGNRSQKAGLAPGTPVHIGKRKLDKVSLTVYEYNEKSLRKFIPDTMEECTRKNLEASVRWINIDGLHNTDILEQLGKNFNLHPLVVEDMLNTEQRPKLEDYGNYVFIVARMLSYDDSNKSIVTEQQSIVLGRDYVITAGEKEGDVFNPVRERLASDNSRIRKMGSDYLAYSILDSIVDNYFIVLEKLGDEIEEVEEMLISKPDPQALRLINDLKRDMLFMHKCIWPLREVTGLLERGESPLINEATHLYLRDVYDHVIQAMDTSETYRDILSGLVDIYLSSLSNRMNEVMKVLTIISTLFIPLTFLAGLYGMNFRYMPELEWHWGYFALLGVMAVVTIFMLYFFKRKKWF